jgi:hypothetical protein
VPGSLPVTVVVIPVGVLAVSSRIVPPAVLPPVVPPVVPLPLAAMRLRMEAEQITSAPPPLPDPLH